MVEKIADLIREGEDIRELSCRKLAGLLGVSKSTLAEDIERLKNHYQPLDDQINETES
jgi:predicted DNA-binding transcriptional regulator YafY